MRGIFIFAGVTLINKFHWIVMIFGGFLVITGIKMLFQKETSVDPEKNTLVRIFRKFFPVTETLHGSNLFIRQEQKIICNTFISWSSCN